MTITKLEAKVAEGVADATFVVPETAGPFPLVVLYADAGGLRPATTQVAERLAKLGYAVIAPNAFWRQQPYAPFDLTTVFGDPAERARLMGMIGKVKADEVASDTLALIDAIDDARVQRDRFATMGYCMGGRLAYMVATIAPERVVAVAALHAGGLVNDGPESPHLRAPKLRAATYFAIADNDPSCTPDHQRLLEEALTGASVRHQLEHFPGTRHGFAMSDGSIYDPAATDRVWQRIEALFASQLHPA